MKTLKQASMMALLGLLALSPRPSRAACTNLWTNGSGGDLKWSYEAENGNVQGTMSVNNDGNASNGQYVSSGSTDSTKDTTCNSGNAGCDTISFTPTITGEYKMRIADYASSANHDSFYIYIAGTPDECGNTEDLFYTTQTWSTYQWDYVVNDDSGTVGDTPANARMWKLNAGTAYSIVVRNDLKSARFDAIQMYLNPANEPATPTPTNTFTPIAGTGTGLCANYFPDMGLTGTGSVSNTAVSYNWGSTGPVGVGVGATGFSARYQGRISFPYAGNYTLSLGSDDGSRMWLGCLTCTPYINEWQDQSYAVSTGAQVAVTSGAVVNIVVEYYQDGGQAQVNLSWSNGVEIPVPVTVPQKYLYLPAAGCSAATATPNPGTPTFTPTITPTPVRVWQGVPSANRLYGLEYMPFPVVSSGGSFFHDLSFPSSTVGGNNFGKNTARYRITFQGLPNGENDFETRIGPDSLGCSTGYWDIGNYGSATTLTLPTKPQNISTTYAWVGTTVPYTERQDIMGDPRYIPYADMLSLPAGQPFADNYNWYFKNIADTTLYDYQADYVPFLTQAVNDRYNGQPNIDIPKAFQLWREGILFTNSIYTSVTGWSSYYLGAGGEIGGDSANSLGTGPGVIAYNGPWGSTGSSGHDEITNSDSIVRTSTWYSMPFIGELWPDSSYASDWSSTGGMASWGNLRNNQQGGSAYRAAWENCSVSSPPQYNQTYHQILHRNSAQGCATFMNGNGGSSTYDHSGTNLTANWLYDAQVTATDYNLSIPSTFTVSRPFGLSLGGNTPPEWSLAPYSNRRTTLDMYTASTQTATNVGFYDWSGGSTRSSAAVRSNWNGNVGWFVMNGLAPATDSGINFVARFAIISCLRTFHEAGAPALSTDGVYNGRPVPSSGQPGYNNAISGVSYRIEPVPYVSITDPTANFDASGDQTYTIQWNLRYARWDGHPYTENYPCVDDVTNPRPCPPPANPVSPGNPNLEWHSLTGTALVCNLIYSLDGGSTWFGCQNNNPETPGVYDAQEAIPDPGSYFYSYVWNLTPLAAGTKKIRAECFRSAFPAQHYAYHEVTFKTAP
jgi:hypothetical protein